MPTKDEPLNLNDGTLFYIPPNGGNPVPLTIGGDILPEPYVAIQAAAADLLLPVIMEVVAETRKITEWSIKHRPRLAHLAIYAKTARKRKKQIERICKEYTREVCGCG